MLRSNPVDRLTSKQLCDELDEIIVYAETKLELKRRDLKPIDNTVRKALLVIDESAGYTAGETPQTAATPPQSHIQVDFAEPGVAASTLYMPVDHMPVDPSSDRVPKRAGKDAKLQKTPLAKTPHRKEILEKELKESQMVLTVKRHMEPTHGFRTHGGELSDSPKQEAAIELSSDAWNSRRSSGDPNGRRASAGKLNMIRPDNRISQAQSLRPHAPIISPPILRNSHGSSEGSKGKLPVGHNHAMFPTAIQQYSNPSSHANVPSIIEPTLMPQPLNLSNHEASHQPEYPSAEHFPSHVPSTIQTENQAFNYEYQPSELNGGMGYAIPANMANASRADVYELPSTLSNGVNFHMPNGPVRGMVPGHISSQPNGDPSFMTNSQWYSGALPHYQNYPQPIETPQHTIMATQYPNTTSQVIMPPPTSFLLPIPHHVYDLEFDVCKVRQALELQQPGRDWFSFMQRRKKEKKDSYLINYINKRDIVSSASIENP
jgi:hypothetical protein